MKKLLILLLCAVLLLSFAACASDKPSFESPVQLYYRTKPDENSLTQSVIGAVTAEGAPYAADPAALLNEYLKGTGEEGFLTTFPASTKLLSMEITDGIAKLQLNASLARLSGTDLTIACACIAKTTMELTGVTTVTLRASGETLDGAESITMTADNLILQDIYEE